MKEILTDSNFLLFATRHYDNPHCLDMKEFKEDLDRIKYIKRLFNRYRDTGDLKERLILNHIIILYNLFGSAATLILFFKLPGYEQYLKPFLMMLNQLPDKIIGLKEVIHADEIDMDVGIVNKLREI